MPDISVVLPNGRDYTLTVPEGMPPEQVKAKAQSFKAAMLQDPYGMHERLYGLPHGFLAATQRIETGGERDPTSAVGRTPTGEPGGRGLMQMTKGTGKKYGLTAKNFLDPLAQIDAAAQLHRDNLKAAGGDLQKAAALYGDHADKTYGPRFMAKLQAVREGREQPHPVGAMGQGAAGPPGGPPGPAGATATAEAPGVLGRAAGAVRSTILGEYGIGSQVTRGAADLNRVGYSLIGRAGGLFADPSEYKAALERSGFPGARRVATDLPHGFLEHLGAASTLPGEVALMGTPAGRVVWGLGTAARELSQSDKIGDAVEGTAGLVLFGRDLYRLGKLVPRAARALPGAAGAIGRRLFTTPAEETYLVAKGTAAATEKTAAEAQTAAVALRTRVEEAQVQAQAVASAAESAAKGNLETATAEHKAALEHVGALEEASVTTTESIRQKMALGSGPTGEQAGEMLRAVGEDVKALAPPGAEEAGVSASAARLAKQRRSIYARHEARADELGVHLSGDADAGAAVMRRRGVQYTKALIHGQGSAAERSIAREFAMLGIKGVRDPEHPEIVFNAKTPAKMRELLQLNPKLEVVYGDVPLSELSKLYAKARTIALSPREYPVSGNQARRQYSRLLSVAQATIRGLSQADPELAQTYAEAQRFVRRIEKPFLAETARKVLATSRTPRSAFDLLLADDPTTITRIFTHATGPEREAYSHAIFHELVQSVASDTGDVDRLALAERFGKLPRETQELLAGFANGAAKMAVDEAVVHRRALETARGAVGAKGEAVSAAKEGLREVRGRKKELLTGLTAAKREYLRRAADDVKAALHAAAQAKRQATQLAEEPRKGSKMVLHFARGMRMFGKMHAIMAVVDLIHGNVARAVLQAGEAAIFLKRPRLVKEALETPINTPRGHEIAGALHAILQRHLGPPQQGSGPVLQPGQRLPAPVAGEAAAAVQTRPAAGGGAVVSPAAGP